jgi:hypothetical protein
LPPVEVFRPGRALVQLAALADLALGVGVLLAAYLDRQVTARSFGQFVFVGALWSALALRCGAMSAMALAIRRDLGLVAFVLLVVSLAAVSDASVATVLARTAPIVGSVLLFGSFASYRALELRERETCAAHPSWQSCVPERAPWTRTSLAVFVSGAEWIVCGGIDAFLRNLWFGTTIAALGVFAVIRARDLAPTHTDARIPTIDRARFAAWWIYPVGAPLLALRVVWILTHAR